MASEFCPSCGQQRTGSFRFCRGCGFDFDSQSPTPRQASATTPTAPAPSPRQQYAQAVREQQGLGFLNMLFVVIGLVVGFVGGVYLGVALGGGLVAFLLALFIGPAVCGFIGSRIALSLWASRG